MLSKARSGAAPLECSFPTDVGVSQSFKVQLYGCDNPLCDCQEVRLEPVFPIYDVEESSILIGYEQVLPFQPVISFELDSVRYFCMDMYCVNRSCHCSTVHLSVISDDQAWCDKDDFLLAVDLKTGNYKVEAQKV